MIEPLVELHDLRKCFGEKEVLRDINAEIHSGDVIGLVGLNGTGKTTLLETALGSSPPTGGSARVFGRESTMQLDHATNGPHTR